jgi:hypothetical protein
MTSMHVQSAISIFIPLLGSLIGLSTILLVYVLTEKSGHLAEGSVTPPISLLGCNNPEHLAYQIGFSMTGLVLLGSLQNWKKTFYPSLQESSGRVTSLLMLVGGYMAVLGVIGQGIVTLEEDFLIHIKMGKGISQQSILHQQLAGVFFLGAAMHCYTTIFYCYLSNNNNNNNAILYDKWSIRVKLMCGILSFVAWPIAATLHPARTGTLNKQQFNIAGLAQYIAVASYILFFGSYSLDFRTHQQQQNRKRMKSK